jgi:transposase
MGYVEKGGFLTENDRDILQGIVRKGVHSVHIIKRAQILLALDGRYGAAIISDVVRVTQKTVYNVAAAYDSGGLNHAIYDKPRNGRPALLDEKADSRIVALACTNPPLGRARWTVKLLLEEVKKAKIILRVGRETIRKLLANHALKPWREKSWCVAKINAEYIKKMEDVLAVYEKPYDPKHPVVCLDEKPVQLLSEPYQTLPAKEGQPKRRDHEYKREGVVNVFCAVEPKTGKVLVRPSRNRKAPAFAKFFRALLRKYKRAHKIHVVMDNLNTHNFKSLVKTFGEKLSRNLWNRVVVHYTPKHASWLNQAEIAIGIYSRQCLGKDRVESLRVLRKRTRLWKKHSGNITINWRFTRKRAREKFHYRKCKN